MLLGGAEDGYGGAAGFEGVGGVHERCVEGGEGLVGECRGGEAEAECEGVVECGGGFAECRGLHAGEEGGDVESGGEGDIIEGEVGIEEGVEEVGVGLDGGRGHGPSIRALFGLSRICLDILGSFSAKQIGREETNRATAAVKSTR